MVNDVVNYAIAFTLTIVLEGAVALLLGYRKPTEIAAVFWVNVFTHPLLNFFIAASGLLRAVSVISMEVLFLEMGVVLVEWLLLSFALPRRSRRGLFILSLTMNSVSYFLPALFHL